MKNDLKSISIAFTIVMVLAAMGVIFWRTPAAPDFSSDIDKLFGAASGGDFSAPALNSPQTYNQPLIIELAGQKISIAPLGAASAKAAVTDNVVKYVDAFANTDIVQTKYTSRIKEDIILKKPGHPAIFEYQIDLSAYDFMKDKQGNLIFYQKSHGGDNGFWRFAIPAPFLIDANGRQSSTKEVSIDLSSDGRLTLRPSAKWLAKAKYPVVLDPTIEISVINIHSHPQQGENWTVNFTTRGTADLKIIPNDQATIDDDEFVSLSCNGEILQPQILPGDIIFYPNWSCNGTGQVIHYTKTAGNHTLRFEFGPQVTYAYNGASCGFCATGGNITNIGGYRIHTFTSSGTFTVTGSGNVEYLVVAGGGGGATYGGGGAGGMRTGTLAVTSGNKTVTVGAGGIGSITTGASGDGGSSVFDSITSIGGGNGGNAASVGRDGGSGGGGSHASAAGNGTSGQGYNGGLGYDGVGNADRGGAGGGASTAGVNATASASAIGGAGASSPISGASVYYAGGGGGGFYEGAGGAGGIGGGGQGGNFGSGQVAGTANTGGGGGSAGEGATAGASGGSGIVIVRYRPVSPIVFRTGADKYAKLLIHANEASGSTALADSSPIPKTITAYGNASTTSSQGKFGNSASFDGTGDYLSLADSEDWNFGSGDFTIDFWAYGIGGVNGSVVQLTHAGFGPAIGYNNGTNLVVYFDDNSTPGSPTWDIATAVSMGALPGNNWVHYAVVRNGSTWTTYRNGTQVSTFESSATIYMPAGNLRVGTYLESEGVTTYYLSGYIDELRISKGIARWTGNFTAPAGPYGAVGALKVFRTGADKYAKLLIHANEANGATTLIDSEAVPKTITANGNASTTSSQGKFGNSASFDGTGDYLSLADSADWNFGSGDFTIDMWVRFNVIGTYITLVQHWGAGGTREWDLMYNDGNLFFRYTTDGSTDQITSKAWSPSTNTWYHITAVRNGSAITLFVDGVQLGTDGTASGSMYTSTNNLYIGGAYDGSYQLNGYLDELRISKGIARWTSNFTPPARPYSAAGSNVIFK